MDHLNREQLLAVLSEAKKENERDWLAIVLAYNHGLRISEVCKLRAQDVAGGFITVKRLKGSLKTTQPLVSHENELLNEKAAVAKWIQNKSARERIIGIERSMLSKLFWRYAYQAKLPRHLRHFHCLKHSICHHVIATAGIENLRQYVGHKSIQSTGQYLRVDDQQASQVCQAAIAAL
jgi:integrase